MSISGTSYFKSTGAGGRAGGGEDFGDQMIFGEGRGISRHQQIIRRTLCGIIRLLQSLIRESVNFKKVNIRSPL